MRIERTGRVSKLTPRLERFFVEALNGVALDDFQDAETRKADYACLGGLLAIELKSLDEDASERLDNLTDELREREDWPVFLGAAPMQAFLKHIDQPEPVRGRIVERIGRAIKNHVHKANKQLAAYEAAFPRKNLVKIVVLANEDHEIYDPEIVAHIVQRLLRRREYGDLLYPYIDAVIFLSERHAAPINKQLAFPILSVEGPSIESALWKRDVADLLLARWSAWNGRPLYHTDPHTQKFTTIEQIPQHMKRYEKWELDYRRNPYMRRFTDEQLRERFDEIICISSLEFIKGAPIKLDKSVIMWSMASMSHMMLEMGHRAIPATRFQCEPQRLAEAARRLRLPANVVAWFERDMDCAT